jgi:SAM-dependent methyltransferase
MKINLGCGTDIKPGFVNVDIAELPGVNVVHDINDVPLPFTDNSAELIYCKDILEHVDLVRVLGDLHRILRPGGRLEVRVPHFTSKNAYSDPTHRNFFTSHTLRYFTREHSRAYYFPFAFSSHSVRVEFDRRFPYNWLMEPLVNLSPAVINVWESSILRVMPAENLYVTLTQ